MFALGTGRFVVLNASPPETGTAVFAGITLSRAGVFLNVSGEDPNWVRNAYGRLKDEVAVTVPKWHWLRSGRMWIPYALVGGATVTYGARPLLQTRGAWWLVLAGVIGAVVLGTAFTLGSSAALPGFQLIREGERERGWRVLGILGAFIVQIAIGVGVNLLTRQS